MDADRRKKTGADEQQNDQTLYADLRILPNYVHTVGI